MKQSTEQALQKFRGSLSKLNPEQRKKVAAAARQLLDTLETDQEPKDRETEAAKARARSALRFAPAPAIIFE